MPGIVHALLVGIDNYPNPQNQLAGCRNDVDEFSEILRLRVQPESLHLKVLIDEAATRTRVIDTFRRHLGQATAGDTAIFYYSGHGSRERSPEVFWTIEPDRLDETLVMWDSREPGGWDLADKELAALIRPLAKKGAHVVVILDSCLSGSGTRAISRTAQQKVRRFPSDVRDRAVDTFLPEVQAVAAERLSESGWDLGEEGQHILLAACRDDQEAIESFIEGRSRGVFSYYLHEALRQTPGRFSYRDLAASVRARVIANDLGQEPQIEATQDSDLDRDFLGGALRPRAISFVASESDGDWWIDAGSIQGVPQPVGAEQAQVALFPALAPAVEMTKVGQAVAVGAVVKVESSRSLIEVSRGALQHGAAYKAVLIGAPIPVRRVRLTGDVDAMAAARVALQQSVLVEENSADLEKVVDFHLECGDGAFHLRRPSDGREMTAASSSADEAVRNLNHITQWSHFVELENPVSAIQDSEFEVKVLSGKAGENELSGTDLRLIAIRNGKRLVAPEFRVRFVNRSSRDLYFAVLALDELFSCSTDLVKAGVMKLCPGEMGWALDGKPLKSQIPKALRDEGRTESRDVLKVIVSTASFNIRAAVLPSLRAASKATSPEASNTLDRLLARSRSRTISAASDSDEIRDFQTKTIFVTTVEPLESVLMTGVTNTDVGAGVRIDAHPVLRARARLTTVEQTRSDVGAAILPPMFRDDDSAETIQFSSSRGLSPAISVLELSDVSDYSAVTVDAPLIVHLPTVTEPGDVVLPVGYDGEDYLVLGRGGARDGETTVRISRLPHPVRNRNRSFGGSIKILFKKFAAPLFGKKYEYPILAEAQWDPNGTVTYTTDVDRIKAKVATAKRIVVFVHGIIGDTRGMGAHVSRNPDDLFLAFDYENLHTTIEANAEKLQERLTDYGLGKRHKKKVVVVAHSMGGLVTRWFIEKLGGREVVSRVILCGTPNAGSNWSTMEDWVTGIASLALNNLTKLSWEAKVIGALFAGLEKIDVTLDQMKPDSPFLRSLAELDDPEIPYTVLAGNTSLV